MKKILILVCVLLAACDPSGYNRTEQKNVEPHRAAGAVNKYADEAYTLMCVKGVEYIKFIKGAVTVVYNVDGTVSKCEDAQ